LAVAVLGLKFAAMATWNQFIGSLSAILAMEVTMRLQVTIKCVVQLAAVGAELVRAGSA
jgi:hypothetical protein